jgi:hypothetical protein
VLDAGEQDPDHQHHGQEEARDRGRDVDQDFTPHAAAPARARG